LLVRNENIGSEEADGSNLEKGIKYLTKAKELNYPKACLNLGKCYENGLGVTQNIDQARALYH
jgi:TPR repeat protein